MSDLDHTCIYACTDSSAQRGETKVSQSSTPSRTDSITSGKNAAKVSADEASGNSSKVHKLY